MKRGFTIVEILSVIAILGILLGIVSTAVFGSLRSSRKQRGEAMCSTLKQAITTYYQQEGKWPSVMETRANNMGDKSKHTFSGDEADKIIRELVKDSVGSKAKRYVLDASAFIIADVSKLGNSGDGCFDNHSDRTCNSFCGNKHCINGRDFVSASNPKNKDYIPIDRMAFGYSGTTNGKFCRLWITYNSQTDAVTVSRKHPGKKYPSNWE